MAKRSLIRHVSLSKALSKGPPPRGNLAVPIFGHGSLVVEMYTPVGNDPQKPHTRDEVYFVARGKGLFFDGERRHAVEAGSFLFVSAGQVHRFEDFSDDFAVWVAFYGAEGGEGVKRKGLAQQSRNQRGKSTTDEHGQTRIRKIRIISESS